MGTSEKTWAHPCLGARNKHHARSIWLNNRPFFNWWGFTVKLSIAKVTHICFSPFNIIFGLINIIYILETRWGFQHVYRASVLIIFWFDSFINNSWNSPSFSASLLNFANLKLLISKESLNTKVSKLLSFKRNVNTCNLNLYGVGVF